LPGLVVATQRRHFDVILADGERVVCLLKGRSLRAAVRSKRSPRAPT